MVRPVFVNRKFKRKVRKCKAAARPGVNLHDLFRCQRGCKEMLGALKFYIAVARVCLFEI